MSIRVIALRWLCLTDALSTVYIRAETDAEAQLFQSQIPTFLALTKNLKSLEVVRDINGVPEGCGSEVLTPTIFVHVLVRVSLRVTVML